MNIRSIGGATCAAVARNASKTESGKLLAVFVVDANDKPLTTPSSNTYPRRVKEWAGP
jgi:hypothetical protein